MTRCCSWVGFEQLAQVVDVLLFERVDLVGYQVNLLQWVVLLLIFNLSGKVVTVSTETDLFEARPGWASPCLRFGP